MVLQAGRLPGLLRRPGCSRSATRRSRRPASSSPILAVDGKTARRSHDRKNGLGALHSVSVWASEYGLSLGQVACAEKSNEITAIPELLRLVDIKGAIITIDAMGTQKAIAEEIIDGGADYVLALKGNQESLHQAVIESHRRAARGRPGRCPGAGDDRDGSRPRGDADLPPAPGPRGACPGSRRVEGPEVDRRGDVAVRAGRRRRAIEVRYYISSLAGGREAVRARGAGPLGRSRSPSQKTHEAITCAPSEGPVTIAVDALLALAAWSDRNSQDHGGTSCSTTTPSASPPAHGSSAEPTDRDLDPTPAGSSAEAPTPPRRTPRTSPGHRRGGAGGGKS